MDGMFSQLQIDVIDDPLYLLLRENIKVETPKFDGKTLVTRDVILFEFVNVFSDYCRGWSSRLCYCFVPHKIKSRSISSFD
jgi:hypothetical protein